MSPVDRPEELARPPDEPPATSVTNRRADSELVAARSGSIRKRGHRPQDTSRAQASPHPRGGGRWYGQAGGPANVRRSAPVRWRPDLLERPDPCPSGLTGPCPARSILLCPMLPARHLPGCPGPSALAHALT